MNKLKNNQQGMVAMLSVVGVAAFSLAIISTLAWLSVSEARMVDGGALEETYYASEAGLNEALYQLINDPVPGDYSFTWGDYAIDVSVDTHPTDPYQRIISSQATSPDGKVRTVQITANTSSYAGGFDYAVQGGAGGVWLANNSKIIGDVYSNGSILPTTGSNNKYITGNAWAAGANTVDSIQITGNVFANNILDSVIGGDAYYQTIDGSTLVNGSSCPNPNCHSGSADPQTKLFPIDDNDVQDWKNDITNTLALNCRIDGVVGPDNTYCVSGSETFGNVKIEGDLYMNNNAILVLTGNIWVTGKIILENNGQLSVDSSLGGGSVVMIADDIVDVSNNLVISGSGDPRSFILVVSMSASMDLTAPAVWASNNSDSIIFAALHGMLKVKQNGELNAAAAETLYLENNAVVTYNPALQAFTIPNGGGERIGVALGTWEEL